MNEHSPKMTADDQGNHRRIRAWRSTLQSFLHESKLILQRHGVTTREYQGMLEIWSAPDAGPKIGELAAAMRLRHNLAVSIVNNLTRKKLAVRHRSEDDRREVNVQLTELGKTVLAALVKEHLSELEKFSADLKKVLT